MPGAPAYCSHCGTVFRSRALGFTDSIGMTVSNIQETCPKCGKRADVLDGTFDFVGDAIKVRKAPPQTIEILAALQEALRAAQGGKSTDEVLAPIKKQSPQLATEAESVIKKHGRTALIVVLLTMLAQCSNLQMTADLNKLIDQMHVYATGKDPYPFGTNERATPVQTPPKSKPKENRPSDDSGPKAPRVLINCPRTGRPVSTGLTCTEARFESIQPQKNPIARCPECGDPHAWKKAEAYLDKT